MRTLGSITLFLLCIYIHSMAGNPTLTHERPTADAQKKVAFFIDSLIFHERLPLEARQELLQLKDIHKYDEFKFVNYIDSVRSIDSIPSYMMHTINYSMNYLTVFRESTSYPEAIAKTCPFPASVLYDYMWCNQRPHPYSSELAEHDTIIHLTLINDSSDFYMPGTAPITSRFGWRNGRRHNGIDLGVYHSLPVYNSFPGVVRLARNCHGYGRLVVVRHYNGLETYYAHLSRIHVKPGQEVAAGDIIGNAGNSGTSRGTHLHYEVRYKGIPLNPAHIICFTENRLLYGNVILRKHRNTYFVYSENAILYKVRRGDYLHRIATEYGTTVQHLRRTNDIDRNGFLYVGQIIRIEL